MTTLNDGNMFDTFLVVIKSGKDSFIYRETDVVERGDWVGGGGSCWLFCNLHIHAPIFFRFHADSIGAVI